MPPICRLWMLWPFLNLILGFHPLSHSLSWEKIGFVSDVSVGHAAHHQDETVIASAPLPASTSFHFCPPHIQSPSNSVEGGRCRSRQSSARGGRFRQSLFFEVCKTNDKTSMDNGEKGAKRLVSKTPKSTKRGGTYSTPLPLIPRLRLLTASIILIAHLSPYPPHSHNCFNLPPPRPRPPQLTPFPVLLSWEVGMRCIDSKAGANSEAPTRHMTQLRDVRGEVWNRYLMASGETGRKPRARRGWRDQERCGGVDPDRVGPTVLYELCQGKSCSAGGVWRRRAAREHMRGIILIVR
jgi:hypothetical protein